ncbi:MAG: lysylphosphatidylglycerol synthase transmembrane domain-containing protein [Geminicoccaceae bacterium]
MSKPFGVVLKLGFGLAIFAVVAYFVDLRETFRVFADLEPGWLVLAVICYLSTRVLTGLKWWVLLGGRNDSVSYPTVQRALLLSEYQGLLVPNTLAIDALRAVLLRHHPRGWTHTAASILADRVISVAAGAATALTALALSSLLVPLPLSRAVAIAVVGISVAILVCVVAVASRRVFALAIAVLRAITAHGPLKDVTGKILRKLGELHHAMSTMLADKPTLIRAAPLALGLVLMRCLWVYFIFLSINEPIDLGWVVTLMPIIMTIALLPLTLFGLGLKDGAFVFFFTGVGVPASAALAVSFVTYGMIIGGALVLGLLATVFGPTLPMAAKEKP